MEYRSCQNSSWHPPSSLSHHPLGTFLWTFWICLLKARVHDWPCSGCSSLRNKSWDVMGIFPQVLIVSILLINSSLLTRIGCRIVSFSNFWEIKTHQQIANSSADLLSASYIYQLYSRWLKVHIFLTHPLELILWLVLEKHRSIFLCVVERWDLWHFSPFFATLFF